MKTAKQLQAEIDVDAKLKVERQISDGSYAPMIVKTIVFGIIGIVTVASVGAVINLIFKHLFK